MVHFTDIEYGDELDAEYDFATSSVSFEDVMTMTVIFSKNENGSVSAYLAVTFNGDVYGEFWADKE